ncbi:hypothetical protein Psed_6912 (plasmid) [Pseudonocardia dioxanivorans CB1190]|uniref:IrrE N-terminal-like domain-containing protein n=1 Tax=Pseudonocardia dioxanivorans (strain ATCC 55486 / DSM 44775 / JCM 13855 / CB1190) TaxID=675635 RepID=F2L707_PSEUX|nr:hypothetical protein [Pseudonocardia dioxanivorans]AEA28980.1 hypothetical protein Psed_6912 [Pseudonocardia dioxanivorans CB1190]
MNRRSLHRLARATVAALDLRPPLDIELLAERFGAHRGKALDLVPADLPVDAAFGITGGDEYCDVIMYQQQTTRTHQVHIILHEMAHLICGHPRLAVNHTFKAPSRDEFHEVSGDMIDLIFGPVPKKPGAVRSGTPTVYDDPIEWEAETMATLLMRWVELPRETSWGATNKRLESALGDPGVWA